MDIMKTKAILDKKAFLIKQREEALFFNFNAGVFKSDESLLALVSSYISLNEVKITDSIEFVLIDVFQNPITIYSGGELISLLKLIVIKNMEANLHYRDEINKLKSSTQSVDEE